MKYMSKRQYETLKDMGSIVAGAAVRAVLYASLTSLPLVYVGNALQNTPETRIVQNKR